MACEAPINAWRPAIGGPLAFTPPQNGRAYTPTQIPCGTCTLCREEQARQQAVRITHEATLHKENSFITVTYSDDKIPPRNGLRYEDLIKFIKRLRKRLKKMGIKMRYYAVGEYGEQNNRPHYHLCIFGYAFTEDRVYTRHTPTPLWTQAWLEEAWGLGQVSVGALTFETANYTASYVTKQLRSKQKYVYIDEETGELIPLEQPKSIKSDNLGKGWFWKWIDQVVQHDYVIINGRRQKPPKAYDKWLSEASKQTAEEIKENRRKHSKKETREQTRARAENARAHARKKKKSI